MKKRKANAEGNIWICPVDFSKLSPKEVEKVGGKVSRVEKKLCHRINKFTQHQLAKLVGAEYVEFVLSKLEARGNKIFSREVTERYGWRKMKSRRTTQYIIKRW